MGKRDARTVAAIILGGGAGTRLFPLTKRRAKPAVSTHSCISTMNSNATIYSKKYQCL